MRRTRRALQDALVALVLERGYDNVTVEDIAGRADVARATFYAHYAHKEDLMTTVFAALADDLSTRVALPRRVPWTTVRTDIIATLYRHADEFRDLYRVCLSGAADGKPWAAYFDAYVKIAERNFTDRVATLGATPRVPVTLMAKAAAGTHLALLRAWLDGELPYTVDEMAAVELRLLYTGVAWGQGIAPDALEYPDVPPTVAGADRPAPAPTGR